MLNQLKIYVSFDEPNITKRKDATACVERLSCVLHTFEQFKGAEDAWYRAIQYDVPIRPQGYQIGKPQIMQEGA